MISKTTSQNTLLSSIHLKNHLYARNTTIILETKNFWLRPVSLDDVDEFVLFWQDTDVMKYIGDGSWGGGKDVVRPFLQECIDDYVLYPGLGFWALVDKETNVVVGEGCLFPNKETNEVEVGYILRRDYWGKGHATELLASLLKYGFEKLNLESIIAVAHPDNKASLKVMEKCGMVFKGTGTYHNRFSVKYGMEKSAFHV